MAKVSLPTVERQVGSPGSGAVGGGENVVIDLRTCWSRLVLMEAGSPSILLLCGASFERARLGDPRKGVTGLIPEALDNEIFGVPFVGVDAALLLSAARMVRAELGRKVLTKNWPTLLRDLSPGASA